MCGGTTRADVSMAASWSYVVQVVARSLSRSVMQRATERVAFSDRKPMKEAPPESSMIGYDSGSAAAVGAIVLNDRLHGAIEFSGVQLARASSREQTGKRSRHWTDLEIYRRTDGIFVAYEVGRSSVEGEIDLSTVTMCGSALDVLAAFTKNTRGILTALATDVLDEAAAKDAEFEAQLGDVHEVEDLVGSIGAGREYVLERDGARALRFNGELLAEASSRHGDAVRWTEIAIFVTVDGRYVLSKQQISMLDAEPVRALVVVASSGGAFVRSLQRPSDRKIERAGLFALRQAASRDPRFAATVSEFLTEPLGVAAMKTPPVPRLHPSRRDSRRIYLEVLSNGARIVTSTRASQRADGRDRVVLLRWSGHVGDLQLPPRRVFLALRHERLIELAAKGSALSGRDDAPVEEWAISALGRQALAAD